MTDKIAKASKYLGLIEQFFQGNEDEDEIAPTPEVFASVREFLKALSDEYKGLSIPELKLFDSNGQIELYLGERQHHIIITFSPALTFIYCPRHDIYDGRAGEGLTNVLNIIKEVFGPMLKMDELHWADPSHAKEKMIAGWEPTTVDTPPTLPTYKELFGQKIEIQEEED